MRLCMSVSPLILLRAIFVLTMMVLLVLATFPTLLTWAALIMIDGVFTCRCSMGTRDRLLLSIPVLLLLVISVVIVLLIELGCMHLNASGTTLKSFLLFERSLICLVGRLVRGCCRY